MTTDSPHPNPGYLPRTATRRRRPAQPSRTRTDLAYLSSRLTGRDVWLAEMLHEHKVLTTHHITALAFPGQRTANRRLRQLYFMGVLDSFRPLRQRGTAAEHYTLGRAGAEVLAARAGVDLAATGWRKDTCSRIAFSPTLEHTLGVNALLVHLATTVRLTTWLSERSANRLWGDWIHPDAYAHTTSTDSTSGLPFFLEYDTGSYNLARVEGKLPGYASLNATTATYTPLLIHTHGSRRETALRRRLASTAARLDLPIATSNTDLGDPTGPVWLPLGGAPAARLDLPQLAAHWPRLTPALASDTASLPVTGRPDSLPWRPTPPRPPSGEE
ncbi:replication-relaxation family protein [Streptomyces sp. TRM66268-LWL]|uniref:Replication-relaxation family protein n=1 Tax=Streptomyces polyasparticus TaxID=2767826 RepID=A0ABR7ST10_9ACTN|nr:replication-relaxation family protein [Streptomyces polyasparticus]MBC9718034.1 replication-relaxation family protein [Streptomyces polyasparticus]